jgi:hypothetical protein
MRAAAGSKWLLPTSGPSLGRRALMASAAELRIVRCLPKQLACEDKVTACVAFAEFAVDGFKQVAVCLLIPVRQANKTDRGSQFPRRRLLPARPL